MKSSFKLNKNLKKLDNFTQLLNIFCKQMCVYRLFFVELFCSKIYIYFKFSNLTMFTRPRGLSKTPLNIYYIIVYIVSLKIIFVTPMLLNSNSLQADFSFLSSPFLSSDIPITKRIGPWPILS